MGDVVPLRGQREYTPKVELKFKRLRKNDAVYIASALEEWDFYQLSRKGVKIARGLRGPDVDADGKIVTKYDSSGKKSQVVSRKGYRLYMPEGLFDIHLDYIDYIRRNVDKDLIPSVPKRDIRMSWARGKDGQYRYYSNLERCTFDGVSINATMVKSIPAAIYILEVFMGKRGFDPIEFGKKQREGQSITDNEVVNKSTTLFPFKKPSIGSIVIPYKNEVAMKSTTSNGEVANKSTTSPTATQPEVAMKSTTSVATTIPYVCPVQNDMSEVLALLKEINAKLDGLSTPVKDSVKGLVTKVTEAVEVRDRRFDTRIDLFSGDGEITDAERFLLLMFERIDYLKTMMSETKAIKQFKSEIDVVGSEGYNLKLAFIASRSRKTESNDVTEYNIRDYYKFRYRVVNGRIVRNPDADKRGKRRYNM